MLVSAPKMINFDLIFRYKIQFNEKQMKINKIDNQIGAPEPLSSSLFFGSISNLERDGAETAKFHLQTISHTHTNVSEPIMYTL